MRAAVEDVHHRHRQQVGVGAADVAVERQRRPSRPRPGRRRARRRGSRWRRGWPCWACRRGRSSSGRRGAGRRRRGPRAPGRSAGRPRRRPSARPCRRSGSPPSRSSTASNAPVDAPLGTAARANEPSSRSTSTSTVGLPRESRISRAPTASMIAMRSAYRGRRVPPGSTRGPTRRSTRGHDADPRRLRDGRRAPRRRRDRPSPRAAGLGHRPELTARRTASRRACSGSTPAAAASATRASSRSPRSAVGVAGGGQPAAASGTRSRILVGEQQRRQRRRRGRRTARARRRRRRALGLDRLPLRRSTSAAVRPGRAAVGAEDVRVAAAHLVGDAAGDVVEGERRRTPRRSRRGSRPAAAGRRAPRAGASASPASIASRVS